MKSIATLTMNPTIDVAYEVESVFHTQKMRAVEELYAPGGGGINVTRVFVRLGGNARCYYLSGGATGPALDGLLDLHQIVRMRVPIAEPTRLATTMFEKASGKEYRIVPPGPMVTPEEWGQCLEMLEQVDCDYLVASGSLPRGVPHDFYVRVGEIMRARGIGMVLDTSGVPLKACLAAGGVLLAKPNLRELGQIVGRELETADEAEQAATEIVNNGQAEMIAVTLGHKGAVFVSRDATLQLPPIEAEVQSAVGAGDSFVAGMVYGLAVGWEPLKAFRYGMAAGTAAVLTPGTNLAYPADIERLYASISD